MTPVKRPVAAVVAPTAVLSNVLAAVGLIVKAPAGLIATVPVPVGLIATFAEAGLNVTVLVEVIVVNRPAAAVVTPIDVLLIVLAAVGLIVKAPAGLMVTVPVPVGLIATLADAGLNVVVLDADRVVKEPVLAVVAPMDALLIVLAAVGLIVNAPAGLIVTVPVPVGLIATFAEAGLNVTVLVEVIVVNRPAAAVVTPIDVLLIVLAAVGLIVKAPAGLMVTVPVPVGLIATLADAGLNVVVLDADRVVKEPVLAVVAPMDALLIVLAAVGLIVNAPAGLIVTVPVPVGLISTAALAGSNVTVLLATNDPFAVRVPVYDGLVAHNAGLVTNTSLVSEPNDTSVPAPLEPDNTLPAVRDSVVPDDV